jgi:hypothetical protein
LFPDIRVMANPPLVGLSVETGLPVEEATVRVARTFR